jgi:Protein tyrosine phosphatase-like protein, PTPLA
MTGLRSGYLASYNSVMAVGWLIVAVQVLRGVLVKGIAGAYDEASSLASTLQWLSILETVHVATGVVHNGVMANILQWLGRSHALFLAVHPEPSLHSSEWAATMLLVWGVGEACRYPMCANDFEA